MRTIDGLNFTSPATEFPLIGSTEQWDIVNTNDPDDDADAGAHMIHLHLLEFQVLNRQAVRQRAVPAGLVPLQRPPAHDPADRAAHGRLPGRRPDPAGAERDRLEGHGPGRPEHVTRIVTRWAPQELPTGGVQPGQNRYPMDVNFPSGRDTFTGGLHVALPHARPRGPRHDATPADGLPVASRRATRSAGSSRTRTSTTGPGWPTRPAPTSHRPRGSICGSGSTTTTGPGSRRSSMRSRTGSCTTASSSRPGTCTRRNRARPRPTTPGSGSRCR